MATDEQMEHEIESLTKERDSYKIRLENAEKVWRDWEKMAKDWERIALDLKAELWLIQTDLSIYRKAFKLELELNKNSQKELLEIKIENTKFVETLEEIQKTCQQELPYKRNPIADINDCPVCSLANRALAFCDRSRT